MAGPGEPHMAENEEKSEKIDKEILQVAKKQEKND